MAYNVFISDKFSSRGLDVLKGVKGIRTTYKPGLKPKELAAKLSKTHALIIRSATKVTAEIMQAAPELKVIGRAGIGVDNVDVPEATRRGIVVMNTPGGNTITTAEHALSLIFSMARNIPQAHAALAQGRWEKSKWIGTELSGKTLGVIGLGNIGSIVAERAAAMKMHVIAHDPFVTEQRAGELGVTLVNMNELLSKSDIISVHVPKSKETKSLIDSQKLRKMKKGVRIINCARGGIVNEQDLLNALDSGKVAGAALDVYETEPITDSPFFGRPDVVVTPHLGASTREAQDKVAVAVAEQVRDFLLTGEVRNAVNMPSVPQEMMQVLAPYRELGCRLGSILGQVATDAPNLVDIEYRGSVTSLPVNTITTKVLCGLLAHFDEHVNEVNAADVARTRGIRIREAKTESHRDHSNLIKVGLQSKSGSIQVAGTRRENDEIRLVDYNGYPLDFTLTGNILIVHNDDVPGVLGSLGTYLGRQGINIGLVQLGRNKPGETAVTLISVDETPTQQQLSRLKRIKHVQTVKRVEL